MNIFTIIVLCLAAGLLITGAVLLKKNIKPILGFFLLIIALILLIGVTMDPKGFENGITGLVSVMKR